MSGHTPGPWRARLKQTSFGNSGAWIVERDTDAEVRTMVCEMPHSATSNPEWPVADAHLIAAAPELLASLKDLARILEAVRWTAGLGKKQADRLKQARAVITKAAPDQNPINNASACSGRESPGQEGKSTAADQ